jgi:hypothetical protein
LRVLKTPVLFLIFNRPHTSQKVFNEIRKAKPSKLFVAADGPRENVQGEKEKCQKAREIIKQLDWDCEVRTLFRDKNLGCKYAVSSAIDWFFNNVEEGIILEDDCLPSQSFFWFCQELLNKYRFNNKIMHINGNNYGKILSYDYSYGFCSYPQVWGWATWKRAWNYYDVEMENWSNLKNRKKIKKNMNWNIFKYKIEEDKFNRTYKNEINTWDYQWHYTIFLYNGIAIFPKKNLVSNIGFSNNATRTKNRESIKANLKTFEINSHLKHPKEIHIKKECNYLYEKYMIGRKPYLIFLKRKIKSLIDFLQSYNLNFFTIFRKVK